MAQQSVRAPEGLDCLWPERIVCQVPHGRQRLAPPQLHRIRREPCISHNPLTPKWANSRVCLRPLIVVCSNTCSHASSAC